MKGRAGPTEEELATPTDEAAGVIKASRMEPLSALGLLFAGFSLVESGLARLVSNLGHRLRFGFRQQVLRVPVFSARCWSAHCCGALKEPSARISPKALSSESEPRALRP